MAVVAAVPVPAPATSPAATITSASSPLLILIVFSRRSVLSGATSWAALPVALGSTLRSLRHNGFAVV
ncbi:hypothetical protein C1I99_30525 [Micromonospora deserti]|uniref:Uncharacterized protein n=1 Tax=Micromonospora deserti TaxID=2070366 RepID=A0A2W2C7L7_9ACTN|nr:hypothetical protein C1I99_30525 [Micromonospora deserti]